MTLSDEFKFLGKVRFWAMVMADASAVLIDPAFPTQAWYVSLGKFLALLGVSFTAIQTLDRNFGDKKVEAAKIDAGYPPKVASEVV